MMIFTEFRGKFSGYQTSRAVSNKASGSYFIVGRWLKLCYELSTIGKTVAYVRAREGGAQAPKAPSDYANTSELQTFEVISRHGINFAHTFCMHLYISIPFPQIMAMPLVTS